MAKGDRKYLDTHTIAGDYLNVPLAEEQARLAAGVEPQGRKSETLVKEAGLSVVLMAMAAGNHVADHAAAGPTTVHVIDGEAVLTVDGNEIVAGPGALVAFGPGVRHDVTARTAASLLITVAAGEH